MNNIFKILPCNPSSVRTGLCMEDIDMHDLQVLRKFGMLETKVHPDEDFGEEYLNFKFGYKIPYFNIFYANKIRSEEDPYLQELIKRLLYLNPSQSDVQYKGITSFILNVFSMTKKIDSAVKIGEHVFVPVLNYEKVYASVRNMARSGIMNSYVPDTKKIVMYSRNTTIGKNDKISINAKSRAELIKDHYESAIHHAAEFLHETDMFVKVSNSRITNTNLVQSKGKVVSKRTVDRYIAAHTKAFIAEINRSKPFKTTNSYKKFEEFTTLAQDLTAEEVAKKLKVSKTTVLEFREAELLIELSNQ
jgi:hypothetical protein